MSEQTQTTTNGKEKGPSKLVRALKLRESTGLKGAALENAKKEAGKRFKAARKDREAKEAAFNDAKATERDATEAMVMAFGADVIDIDGALYEPSSRGDDLYYRRVAPSTTSKI